MNQQRPNQDFRLGRPSFARLGLSNPSQNRGFGNPLGAFLDLLRLVLATVQDCFETALAYLLLPISLLLFQAATRSQLVEEHCQ